MEIVGVQVLYSIIQRPKPPYISLKLLMAAVWIQYV